MYICICFPSIQRDTMNPLSLPGKVTAPESGPFASRPGPRLVPETSERSFHGFRAISAANSENAAAQVAPHGNTGQLPMMADNDVSIVDYDARYRSDFKRLNEAWIREYFELEDADHKVLDRPDHIIDSGGEIVFAVAGDQVLGTCALIKMEGGRFDFELAKMAVDPAFRGRGIGRRLGEAIIERARELGAQTLFLESDTILGPALRLYRKLGFEEISRQPSPYARGNVYMVRKFTAPHNEDGSRP